MLEKAEEELPLFAASPAPPVQEKQGIVGRLIFKGDCRFVWAHCPKTWLDYFDNIFRDGIHLFNWRSRHFGVRSKGGDETAEAKC